MTTSSPSANPFVVLETSMGNITIELDNAKAPLSTANFLQYVDGGHYDGTIFHRVIGNFMIQGGGFTPSMDQKKTGPQIKNEWKNGLSNKKYTLAMARLGNQPDSATAQFFINVQDNAFLDQPRDGAGYAVFGRVTAGTDVVDKIKGVRTGVKNGMGDVPVEPVVITKARRG
ncbi:MAG TPA: peptidylprolyl isomerase [Phycisphaerales bacterium]|nr:peptidylprolyl isomerase [Phycisphaerales bacterium]